MVRSGTQSPECLKRTEKGVLEQVVCLGAITGHPHEVAQDLDLMLIDQFTESHRRA